MSRKLLVALAVVLVLVAAGALVVRRALDPETLRPLVESQLTGLLGQPVSVERFDISWLPTPAVSAGGISMRQAAGRRAPSLGLGGVRVVPRLSSLLSSPFVIERIELDGLELNVRRDAQGRWQLPFGAKASPGEAAPAPRVPGGAANAASPPAAGTGTAASPVQVLQVSVRNSRVAVFDDVLRSPSGSEEVAVIGSIAGSLIQDGSTRRLQNLTATVGSSRVTGAATAGAQGLTLSLQWLDLKAADLPQLFGLLGASAPKDLQLDGERPLQLDLTVTPDGDVSGSGKLSADRLALGTLTITEVQAPLALSRRRLEMAPIVFKAYGGNEHGRLTAALGDTPVTWQLATEIDGLDLNALLSANTSARDVLTGVARLSADLRGRTDQPLERSVEGTLAIGVGKGLIRNFPLLASINRALALTGGSGKDTEFDSLDGHFAIANGRARTSDLRLVMGELTVRATGSLGFDQTLDLAGTCILTAEKSRELSAKSPHFSALKNGQGEMEVPLTIGGTFSNPGVGIEIGKILERAAGKELERQLRRGLDRLFKKP